MLRLRLSPGGFIASGLFLLIAIGVFAWIFFIASKNPADSGESGLWLLLFALPWVYLVPEQWLGPGAGIGCIFLNAFLLYCVFGGLRVRTKAD